MTRLDELRTELRKVMESQEYAYAMGSSHEGGKGHPKLVEVMEKVKDLRCQIQEHV